MFRGAVTEPGRTLGRPSSPVKARRRCRPSCEKGECRERATAATVVVWRDRNACPARGLRRSLYFQPRSSTVVISYTSGAYPSFFPVFRFCGSADGGRISQRRRAPSPARRRACGRACGVARPHILAGHSRRLGVACTIHPVCPRRVPSLRDGRPVRRPGGRDRSALSNVRFRVPLGLRVPHADRGSRVSLPR